MQKTTPTSSTASTFPSLLGASVFSPSTSTSRPTTRDGSTGVDPHHRLPPQSPPPPVPGSALSSSAGALPFPPTTHREPRKSSFSRKAASLSGASTRRRGSSATSVASSSSNAVVTDATAPPALPDYALPVAARVQSRDGGLGRSPVSPEIGGGGGGGGGGGSGSGGGGGFGMLSRTPTSLSTMTTGGGFMIPPPTPVGSSIWQPSEASVIHQQITDVATKRISTLDYLRKAHEGRVYWFNTYLFDKPDLARMPCFDPRRLARKATNYLLLGLSVPTINDLYSSSALEFLRCLNALLSEFDSFQQLHGDSPSSASLTRARLPNMFRRPGGKSRRSTSAADIADDPSQAFASAGGGPGGPGAASAPSVMNFAAAESDLLPGEEYTYLLTPSLPFEPDFFETFATLCDVLIDCYTRFLALVPTPRECSAPVAELFNKADAKLRKIIVQGVVKEFEDHSRSHVKTEVASIGKVVLGGLM